MKRRILLAATAAATLAGTAGCFAEQAAPATGADRTRLRVGMAFAPDGQLSPYTDDATLITQLGAAEPLVRLKADGQAEPALAASWTRPDARTVRLTLRDGVTFHDGTALTAQAAADALTNATAAKPVPRAIAAVKLTATAVDDTTVEVRAAQPDPVLLNRLASPQLVILAPKAYQKNAGSPDPVGHGTGPFRFTTVQGSSAATLERFDTYWGGRPQLTGLDVRFLPDGAARAGALRAGEVDVVNALPVAQLPNITGRRVIEIPLPRTIGLHLVSTEGKTFADAGLRAAAKTAIDPAAITATVYENRADAPAGLFGPASAWATAGRAAVPAVTPAAAADPAGRKITLATYTDRPELPEVATAIAAAWKARGFEVETVVREYTVLEPDLLTGTFDAVLGTRSYLLDSADPIGYLRSDFSCDGSYNLARFCDPAVDTRLDTADALTDITARQTAALQIEADLTGHAITVPIGHERARIGTADNVTGITEDPYERTLVTAGTTLR
ncbi:ABC transporter substrate-binding protein [Actinoplanes xinjiangensis]|uniref:Peptide/nickel transport system substrate-binding protein n=1 Tax=Actinoplanes xinjiangensis TaxID=512350 RepID=A0A316F4I4_9ACTN|nr:ABC transporter substrate-binding protein [Actinoplanes xinjiangensis]PWK40533.1 peptide/nickel transport system substrate-binding protein [Actinoplanes xinjiangensis]GIF42248.1 ABC transporter substrate-binding protein [Actinoplanes xinjiangensis]